MTNHIVRITFSPKRRDGNDGSDRDDMDPEPFVRQRPLDTPDGGRKRAGNQHQGFSTGARDREVASASTREEFSQK